LFGGGFADTLFRFVQLNLIRDAKFVLKDCHFSFSAMFFTT
jgi:hypothetical protein